VIKYRSGVCRALIQALLRGKITPSTIKGGPKVLPWMIFEKSAAQFQFSCKMEMFSETFPKLINSVENLTYNI
jgi:hypothetical protein